MSIQGVEMDEKSIDDTDGQMPVEMQEAFDRYCREVPAERPPEARAWFVWQSALMDVRKANAQFLEQGYTRLMDMFYVLD